MYSQSISRMLKPRFSFGQKLMRIYNQKGIFSNTKDSEEGLTHILSEHFENVKTKVQGTVVMFSASGKK
ncbi:hypothetical protein BFD70_00060 [Escherichia coli]|nr:hypothetical protein BFD70_00060 [Escherichia coli]